MRRELTTKRIYLRDIFFCLFKFPRRFLLFEFIHLQPKRVLEHRAAVARAREQYPVCLALGDDVVTRLADICARKELVDIAQAHLGAVDGILARAVAEGRALDGHFIKIYLELPKLPAQAGENYQTR